jgi:hypothetical protein
MPKQDIFDSGQAKNINPEFRKRTSFFAKEKLLASRSFS